MAGMIADIVHPLSNKTKATSAAVQRQGWPCDIAIGGVRFNLDPSADAPIVRRTAQFKKDQFDAEAEPGEQSLTGWWLRSQASFHTGAGVLYQEDYGYDNTYRYAASNRFRDSLGVDVWTQGQLSLLHDTTHAVTTSTASTVTGGLDGTTPVMFYAEGPTVSRITPTGSSVVATGATGTVLDVAVSATDYYVADNTGIFKGSLGGGAGSRIYNIGASRVKLGWVKQRLVAGIDNAIYELDTPTLPAALYTHPSSSWTWTAIVAGPQAIYAAGYAGGSSSILEFTLDATGAMPTLSSAITVAELPLGEIVTSLFSYLGTYLVIGTNKGVRVATMDAGGNVTYGPLSVELPDGAGPVMDMVGKDRFVFCTATNGLPDGTSGLYRLDLSADSTGRFPWASDLQSGVTGTVSSVALLGDQVAFTVDGAGLWIEHPTNLVPSGYLRTGRIRYRTIEPKLFKYIRVRTDALQGSVAISVLTDQDSEIDVATLTKQGATDHEDAALPAIGGQESMSVKLTLVRTASPTAGPVVRSYQVKALPGTKRQREILLPLLCYDFDTHSSGQRSGYIGYALDRLEDLEGLEDSGDAVLYQDWTNPERPLARLVVIDQLEFTQSFPPEQGNGLGGRLVVTLRSVD